MKKPIKISFEFFPPKSEDGMQKLCDTASLLNACEPAYYSVTFGAGGSTQANTGKVVEMLKKQGCQDVAPHISCVGTSKQIILDMLADYQAHGVKRLVVLRGDMPSGSGAFDGEFKHACDLVAFIRDQFADQFHISVAAYPECHPEAKHMEQDLLHFKQKVEAGANDAITQYFYSAQAYENFLNACARLKINIPIVPGIMPITNYHQLARLSNVCGAELPRWIRQTLEAYGDDLASIRAFGHDVVSRLCEQLIALGAPALHFYTLNKAKASEALVLALQ